jgi:lipopolysaccharide heptosyltransferase I
MNILIVRLGALGDIVHAVPAAAALHRAFPGARLHWLVDAKHRAMVDLVSVVERVFVVAGRTPAAWVGTVRALRQTRYDAALDLQGLMKSAVLARASGAARVLGFSIWHLREKAARPFYSEVAADGDAAAGGEPEPGGHVIAKNLRLLRMLGIETDRVEFPLARVASAAAEQVRAEQRGEPFALLNPGAAWPNKRWPAARFGEIAAFLREVRGLSSVVLWGPGEEALAHAVVAASNGTARPAPMTNVGDLLELARAAALMVSGDTGPLHIAAAAGTPIVAVFGPTNPRRNGPWLPADVVVSRYDACGCHYDRRCHEARWCLEDVGVAELTAAIQQRLGTVRG